MTTLTLIRHGETEWNRAGRWQGHTDISLSELGRAQAHALAKDLAKTYQHNGRCFDALYSSDLSRAFETAQIIGAALGLTPIPLPDVREIDLGCWSGLNNDQIKAAYPEDWARIEAGEDVPRGGAECFNDLQRRVCTAVERLEQLHRGQHLGIVTHGGVIRAFILASTERNWTHRHTVGAINNTSVTVIQRTLQGWSIERVNDSRHLETTLSTTYPYGEGNN